MKVVRHEKFGDRVEKAVIMRTTSLSGYKCKRYLIKEKDAVWVIEYQLTKIVVPGYAVLKVFKGYVLSAKHYMFRIDSMESIIEWAKE